MQTAQRAKDGDTCRKYAYKAPRSRVFFLRAGGNRSEPRLRDQPHVEALLEGLDLLAHADVDEEVRCRKAEAPELQREPT
eukprot:15185171-Heterocapsa_arctica.AAC.1